MRRWQNGLLMLGVICCVFALLGGCDYLGLDDDEELFEDNEGDNRSNQPTPTPKSGTPRATRTPKSTPTPNNDGGADFVVRDAGDMMEFNLGNKSSGTFHFEARGFDPNRYGGDTSHLKPVYFWLYNGVYDYGCSGLLFEVRQLMYANYWCVGGKIKGRNNGHWTGEECYEVTWSSSHWYSIDITWGGGRIAIYVDGSLRSSMGIGNISGNVIAGIGWPPARREGIVGLQYRNVGLR